MFYNNFIFILSIGQISSERGGKSMVKRPNSGSLTKRRGSRKARSLRSTHLAMLSSTHALSRSSLDDTHDISRESTPTPPIGI